MKPYVCILLVFVGGFNVFHELYNGEFWQAICSGTISAAFGWLAVETAGDRALEKSRTK